MRAHCYYPDSNISERLTPLFALYSDLLAICIPDGIDPEPWIKQLINKNVFLLMKTPHQSHFDFKKIVGEFIQWGAENIDSIRDSRTFSNWLNDDGRESRYTIINHIRGKDQNNPIDVEPKIWQSYMLTHFFNRFNEEQHSMQNLLSRVEKTGNSLAEIIGAEDVQGEVNPGKHIELPENEEYMISERIGAWACLFGEVLSHDAAILTTNQSAHEILLNSCRSLYSQREDHSADGMRDDFEPVVTAGPFSVPVPRTADFQEIMTARETWAHRIRLQIDELLVTMMSPESNSDHQSWMLDLQRSRDKMAAVIEETSSQWPPRWKPEGKITICVSAGISADSMFRGCSPSSPINSDIDFDREARLPFFLYTID